MSIISERSNKRDQGEVNPIYFCYSPNQNAYLQREGLRLIGVGINENTGRKFWQYERGAELDRLLDAWTANRPK